MREQRAAQCKECNDVGWESHPCQSDPLAPHIACPHCELGIKNQANLIPREYLTSYMERYRISVPSQVVDKSN